MTVSPTAIPGGELGSSRPGDGRVSPDLVTALASYLENALGDAGVGRLLASLPGIEPAMAEPRRWIPAGELFVFAEAAAAACGDPDIGRRVGEELFRAGLDGGVADFITATGSIPAACEGLLAYGSKMTTGLSFRIVGYGDSTLVIEGSFNDPSLVHPLLCSVTAGYYAQLPSLFGQLGTVAEVACQALGDEVCRYRLSWRPDPRARPAADPVASAARGEMWLERLEELREMASAMVRAKDIDEVLDTITERAGTALQAPRYLLVTRLNERLPVRVHHRGVPEHLVGELARRALDGELGEADGALVADVVSSRRPFGRLVALFPEGSTFTEIDRRLFAAYADHAAASLDVVASLGEARQDRDTAKALLDLARAMARMGTVGEISNRLAELVPGLVGCDIGTVWLWDDAEATLRIESWHDAVDGIGFPGPDVIRPTEVPGLGELMERPGPDFLTAEDVPAPLQVLFDTAGLQWVAIVPMIVQSRFHGLIAGGFRGGKPDDERLYERLEGLADHATAAIERTLLLERVRHQALHDALTGLPNRILVEDRTNQVLSQLGRTGGVAGLLFIDLDRFKNINDSFGHRIGDDLICQVAARLQSVLRASDTLARLGGDEFVVLVPRCAGVAEATEIAERLIVALHTAFPLEGGQIFVSCSIGIACAPRHASDYSGLMQKADIAMYQAKNRGRNTYAVYRPRPARSEQSEVELEAQLHDAIENGQLEVHYQPQRRLSTGEIVGVEALVRWNHPVRGLLGPSEFLDAAEESGLVVAMDACVRRTALTQAADWERAGTPIRLALNVSTRDLHNPELAEILRGEIASAGVSPSLVELEVTDRVAMSTRQLPEVLDRLRAVGVRIAVDDFGTGNSVLRRLQTSRIDLVKVDRSFIEDIVDPTDPAPILAAIASLCQGLGLSVLVEGVERPAQDAVLRARGCDLVQGYLYGRPQPAAELTSLLSVAAG